MKSGCFMGIAPTGYKNYRNEDGHATLKVNTELSSLIQNAFEEFSQNLYSAEDVRKKFYKQGLKVSKQGFLNMLRNPVYTGKILIPEWKKEDAAVVSGLHDAIVDEGTYSKVQNIINGKKKFEL